MEETKDLTISQSQKGINIFGSIEGFEAGQRIAKVFASSSFVPDVYKGNIGNCMIGLNMAIRMNADPLMVLQNLVVVHGTPTFEAKFAIACFNATGRYSTLSYAEVGERGKDTWGMYAYAIELKTGEVKKGPVVTIQMAKDEGWYSRNPKWKSIPELMLRYRSASWFIRTTDSGIMMGFQTRDEVEDTDWEEIHATNASVEQLTAEEKLAQAQQQEEQQANSQSLDMNNGEKKEENKAADNQPSDTQKVADTAKMRLKPSVRLSRWVSKKCLICLSSGRTTDRRGRNLSPIYNKV